MGSLGRDLSKMKRDSALETLGAVVRYVGVLRKRSAYRSMLQRPSYRDRFAQIYAQRLWHSQESGSGQGSEIAYTEKLRKWLPKLVSQYNIKSVVDAPCGDFNWMRLVLPRLGVSYRGFDIVDGVIQRNISKYGSDRVEFSVADICADPLPDCNLLIVRDCLFHLSFAEIDRFLGNIDRTNYQYLLTTTHIVDRGFENTDISSGDFRLIDLFAPPFRFAVDAVLEQLDDFPEGYEIKRKMVLFKKEDVPTRLSWGAQKQNDDVSAMHQHR